jgi:hypothetical protein
MFTILKFVRLEFEKLAEFIEGAINYRRTPPNVIAVRVGARRLAPPKHTPRKF